MSFLPVSRVLAWLVLGLAISGGAAQAQALAPIEAHYAAPGPLAVQRQTVFDDAGRKQYEVFVPVPLGRERAVVVWGNGTGALPKNYAQLLSHLASWGFVAIDTYDRNTGTGETILGAAQFLVDQNAAPASPLYQRLALDRFGAAGHSQGASGVVNAATNFASSAIFKTVVPIALPTQAFTDPEDRYDTSKLSAAMFLISGTEDVLISPLSTNRSAFNKASDALPAALGMLKGAGHNEIQPDGGRERGYLTAWLMFRLQGDAGAAAAFTGPEAELLANTNWKSTQTQSLP